MYLMCSATSATMIPSTVKIMIGSTSLFQSTMISHTSLALLGHCNLLLSINPQNCGSRATILSHTRTASFVASQLKQDPELGSIVKDKCINHYEGNIGGTRVICSERWKTSPSSEK